MCDNKSNVSISIEVYHEKTGMSTNIASANVLKQHENEQNQNKRERGISNVVHDNLLTNILFRGIVILNIIQQL